MSMHDPLGPFEEGIAADSAAEVLLALITANAEQHERKGLPRSVMDQLAAIGWLGLAPSVPLQRERAERLAMADVAVWFVGRSTSRPYVCCRAQKTRPSKIVG